MNYMNNFYGRTMNPYDMYAGITQPEAYAGISMPQAITTVPHIIKQTNNGERGYDLLSRILEDRIIFLNDEVNADTSQIITAELLHLAAADSEKPITMYINSPGGSVSAGLAIYDTMNYIKPAVRTICTGMAASMGAFLLSGGEKGMRYCLPNSEVMIHQPLGGMQGQATEMQIAMDHMNKTKKTLTEYLAKHTGRTYEEIHDATERDNWMSAEEALEFGLIDKIVQSANEVK